MQKQRSIIVNVQVIRAMVLFSKENKTPDKLFIKFQSFAYIRGMLSATSLHRLAELGGGKTTT